MSWWSLSRGPILIFLCSICTEREMAGQDSVDEMEQMMLQMEQMKELIVVLKQEWQEEAERFERVWSGDER